MPYTFVALVTLDDEAIGQLPHPEDGARRIRTQLECLTAAGGNEVDVEDVLILTPDEAAYVAACVDSDGGQQAE